MDYVDRKHGELYRCRSQTRLEQKLGLRPREPYQRLPHLVSCYDREPTVNRYVWHMHDTHYNPVSYDITTRYDRYKPLASAPHYRPAALDCVTPSRTFAHSRDSARSVHFTAQDEVARQFHRDIGKLFANHRHRYDYGPLNRAPFLGHRLSEQAGQDFLASKRYDYRSCFT
jgi:hypothetical protein